MKQLFFNYMLELVPYKKFSSRTAALHIIRKIATPQASRITWPTNIIRDFTELVYVIYLTSFHLLVHCVQTEESLLHRKRIYSEEKAKVVAAVWGKNLFNSLTRKLFCTGIILKNRMNSYFSSNHPGAFHPILQFVLLQNS